MYCCSAAAQSEGCAVILIIYHAVALAWCLEGGTTVLGKNASVKSALLMRWRTSIMSCSGALRMNLCE